MQEKRRRLNGRQQRADVPVHHGAQDRLSSPWAGAGAQLLRQPTAKPLVTGSAGHKHRRHGVGTPQLVDLGDDRLGIIAGEPNCVVVAGQVLGCGMDQDQRADPFRFGAGEEDRGWGGFEFGQDGGPFRADLVQDNGQLFNMRLPGRQRIGGQRI